MANSRYNLAHLAWALLACACSLSHGDHDVDSGTARRDAGETRSDAGRVLDVDASVPPSACSADRARAIVCPDAVCDEPPLWYWNGDSCHAIECSACSGEDCEVAGFYSLGECEAAHASCEASLCRATEGAWHWWAEECGHYDCGTLPPQTCIIGFAICDCGLHRRFQEGVGCIEVDDCPLPEPGSYEEMCGWTGGVWGDFCCASICGEYCADACLAPACHCGEGRIFDEARGCIESPECYERSLGQRCANGARCETGTICCDSCGGPGCTGMPRCITPVCDDNPAFDECGNCLACA